MLSNHEIEADKRPKKKPTSFLSLPLELRQSILLQIFDPKKETKWFYLILSSAPVLYYHIPAANSIDNWCRCFGLVHLTIEEDLVYVKEKWIDGLRNLEKAERVKGWRRSAVIQRLPPLGFRHHRFSSPPQL